MAGGPVAVVVGASEEERAHIKQCLPADWGCENISPSEDDLAVISTDVKLFIVRARKEQKDTLAICGRLRESAETSETPILLVIGRYELDQGHAVVRAGRGGFIITPFDAQVLQVKIDGLLRQTY